MSNLYDLGHSLPLTSEEADPEKDMVPVYHPMGGGSTERSMTLSAFAAALSEAPPAGGVSKADFDELKANVIADLNNLRDAIMYTQASLDADAGVATDTFVLNGTPPPLVTE
jgi:hypothetical protein